MITRAQAEALLTLAEALEACERTGVSIEPANSSFSIFYGNKYTETRDLTGMSVRLAVNALVPKHTGS